MDAKYLVEPTNKMGVKAWTKAIRCRQPQEDHSKRIDRTQLCKGVMCESCRQPLLELEVVICEGCGTDFKTEEAGRREVRIPQTPRLAGG